jgi:hypothetical protein
MKISETTKVVTLISGIVAIFISIGGFILDWRLKLAEQHLNEVKQGIEQANATIEQNTKLLLASSEVKQKEVETEAARMANEKREFELSARLKAHFILPLARTFAVDYKSNSAGFAIPTSTLADELKKVLPLWESRKELMTGKACSTEGLAARQIISLTISNIGIADANELEITLSERQSQSVDSTSYWQELSEDKRPLPYYDLSQAAPAPGWKRISVPLHSLYGSLSAGSLDSSIVVVLASVSGSTHFYGSVYVPIELNWTDSITKKKQTLLVMDTQGATLRSGLVGAEIGSVAGSCR